MSLMQAYLYRNVHCKGKDKDPIPGVLVAGFLKYPLLTLELPYLDNKKNESSIPVGSYVVKRREISLGISVGIGQGFEVLNVPNRSAILIHVANNQSELRGCIAVGSSHRLGKIGPQGRPEVMLKDSGDAFKRLLAEAPDIFNLNILRVDDLCLKTQTMEPLKA